jgi:hypothetical protein
MPVRLIGESICRTERIEQSVLDLKVIEILFVRVVPPCRVHCEAELG